MNILLLTTHANTGGITSYLLTLSEGLVNAGHKVFVVSSGGNCVEALEQTGAVHVRLNIRTKSEMHPKLWLALPHLQRLVHQKGIHIVHSHTRVTQVLGSWLHQRMGVPMVSTCHGFFRPRWFRRIFPCWGQAVIAISQPVAEHLEKDLGVIKDHIYLVSNGIDLKRFAPMGDREQWLCRQRWGLDQGPIIGIIARLSKVKGIDVLINAMVKVVAELPAAQLMIVGQGPEENRLRWLVRDLSLNGRVRFEPVLSRTAGILPAFDVFAMPSRMEGLGLSVMEAMACGVPVVASRVGGLGELIEDGRTGCLVPVGDTGALAGHIIDILKDPSRAHGMAVLARKHMEDNFSAEQMVAKTIKVYEQYSGC